MLPATRLLFVIVASAALAACGARRHGASTAPDFLSDAVLTSDQIERSTARTAYDAVQWLCPPRVRSTVDQRAIFVDGVKVGGTAILKGMPTDVIHEIRWLDPRDAVIRYGSANPDGIILIVTKPAS